MVTGYTGRLCVCLHAEYLRARSPAGGSLHVQFTLCVCVCECVRTGDAAGPVGVVPEPRASTRSFR